MINFRGTTFIDEGSSDFILVTGVVRPAGAGRSGVGFGTKTAVNSLSLPEFTL